MSAPALDVKGVSSGYGEAPVLRDVSFDVRPGEIFALLGKNGMGKSTLLKSVMGFLPLQGGSVGVFGGHVNFGDPRRFWDFRSLGHGDIKFEDIIVALNDVGYRGPLSVEWEDIRMDRVHGATEAAQPNGDGADIAPDRIARSKDALDSAESITGNDDAIEALASDDSDDGGDEDFDDAGR